MPNKSKKHHQTKPLKKGYSSPQLTNFGTIKELTAGGSAGKMEMEAMTDPALRS